MMYSVQIKAKDQVIEPRTLYSLEEVLKEYPRATAQGLDFVVRDAPGNIVKYEDLQAKFSQAVSQSIA